MKRNAIGALVVSGLTAAACVLPATAASAASGTGDYDHTLLEGKTVWLDPGHQQSAAGHNMQKQVNDGYGGKKDCQTSGMTSVDGVPEYKINYQVATIVKGALESLGADVDMSRGRTGWGGCITDRADAANKSGADVAVSIHADSTKAGKDTKNHGFHTIIPKLSGITDKAAKKAQKDGGRKASKIMRHYYEETGFTPANYIGDGDGISLRSDIAGPALTEVPLVLIEMGNGSNPTDAKMLESAKGQTKHASAITSGIAVYLAGGTPAAEEEASTAGSGAANEAGGNSGAGASAKPGRSSLGGGETGIKPVDRVLDQVDDVMGLFRQISRVRGVDGLVTLINDGNIATLQQTARALGLPAGSAGNLRGLEQLLDRVAG